MWDMKWKCDVVILSNGNIWIKLERQRKPTDRHTVDQCIKMPETCNKTHAFSNRLLYCFIFISGIQPQSNVYKQCCAFLILLPANFVDFFLLFCDFVVVFLSFCYCGGLVTNWRRSAIFARLNNKNKINEKKNVLCVHKPNTEIQFRRKYCSICCVHICGCCCYFFYFFIMLNDETDPIALTSPK